MNFFNHFWYQWPFSRPLSYTKGDMLIVKTIRLFSAKYMKLIKLFYKAI